MERRSASGATSSFPIISSDAQTRDGTGDIHARLGYDMTRIRTLITLSLVMMTGGFAQEQSTLEISLSSGYVLPASPMTFARYWTMQSGGSLSAGMALSPSMVVQASVDYCRFTMNAQGVAENFDTQYMRTIWIFSDVSQHPSADLSSIVTVSAGVRVSSPGFSGTFSPYVLAGAGAMFSSIAEIALPTTSVLELDGTTVSPQARQRIIGGKESAAFLQGGLGMDARLSAMWSVFVETRFALGMTQNLGTAYVPVTAGVRLRL